jgi:hypothetical protein
VLVREAEVEDHGGAARVGLEVGGPTAVVAISGWPTELGAESAGAKSASGLGVVASNRRPPVADRRSTGCGPNKISDRAPLRDSTLPTLENDASSCA